MIVLVKIHLIIMIWGCETDLNPYERCFSGVVLFNPGCEKDAEAVHESDIDYEVDESDDCQHPRPTPVHGETHASQAPLQESRIFRRHIVHEYKLLRFFKVYFISVEFWMNRDRRFQSCVKNRITLFNWIVFLVARSNRPCFIFFKSFAPDRKTEQNWL